MKEKLHQKETRDKEFADYEKKYLEEIEKTNLQNKKLKEELQQNEDALHEARIARRLELEKASGKNYDELLSKSKPEPAPQTEPKPTQETLTRGQALLLSLINI